jgi:UDP-glucose:glycoprotein glucosyltransferase
VSADLQLFANLEYNRVGAALDKAIEDAQSGSTEDFRERSNSYLRMASFVGSYGGAKGISRQDVSAGLAELGVKLTSGSGSAQSEGKKKSKKSKKSTSSIVEKQSDAGSSQGDDDVVGVLGATGTYTLTIPPSASAALSTGENDMISIVYLLDPLSVAGQRAVSLINLFAQSLNMRQHVVLAPRSELTEFPLQNFYRFVASPHTGAHEDGSTAGAQSETNSGATAYFRSLPKQHTLTVRVDGPEPWNIQAFAATQDIDNLVCPQAHTLPCGDAGRGELTVISYVLKNILFTGTCAQTLYGGQPHHIPPNGLQLTFARLTASSHNEERSLRGTSLAESSDTLVMQNLGYYQLQANPGLWSLNLAPGRARYLYDMDFGNSIQADIESLIPSHLRPAIMNSQDPHQELSTTGLSEEAIGALIPSAGKVLAVKSFSDVFHRLIVHKRKGKENVPLLQDSANSDGSESQGSGEGSIGDVMNGLWESVTSMFGTPTESSSQPAVAQLNAQNRALAAHDEDNMVHVFSLATGQMYERLLRIMMLSVTKRTSVKVKVTFCWTASSSLINSAKCAFLFRYSFGCWRTIYHLRSSRLCR